MANGHGGSRRGAGRKTGSPNQATADQKRSLADRAKQLSNVALDALAEIAAKGQSESARVSAACALLDRGYGRPKPVADLTEAEKTETTLSDLFPKYIREGRAKGALDPGNGLIPARSNG